MTAHHARAEWALGRLVSVVQDRALGPNFSRRREFER